MEEYVIGFEFKSYFLFHHIYFPIWTKLLKIKLDGLPSQS